MIARVTFDISSAKREVTKLLQMYPYTCSRAMQEAAMRALVPQIQARIRKQRNVFTGDLAAKMSAKSGVLGKDPFVEVGSFGVPYGLNVEVGSPPHSPDPAKILAYVERKMRLSGAEAAAKAAGIIASIQASGTKASPYLMPTWKANQDAFFDEFLTRMRAFAAMSGGTS